MGAYATICRQRKRAAKARRACLVVIKGRRRIGKSRLAEEFGRGKQFLSFTGLAPLKGVTGQDQRDVFSHQLAAVFRLPLQTFTDWSDAGAMRLFIFPDVLQKNRR